MGDNECRLTVTPDSIIQHSEMAQRRDMTNAEELWECHVTVYDADRTAREIIFHPRVIVERPSSSSWESRDMMVVVVVPIVE